MAIRYISDLHFGHSNIIRFDMRPFESTEEMDRELVKRWNDVVDKDDQVYVLGDMFWKKADEAIPILKELKGNKFLVRGNHDRVGDRNFDKCFARITDYTEVEDEGRHVILCHYPFLPSRTIIMMVGIIFMGMFIIHGRKKFVMMFARE